MVSLSQVVFSTARTRASSAVPLGHGLSSATGTRASSAVPLSRGIYSATGVRAPNAAAINHGAKACALSASPRHASRINKAAVNAIFGRKCASRPLPDHVVAVGSKCGTADPKTTFPDHEVAVGVRCGKANTTAPVSFARLDPMFLFAIAAGALSFFPSTSHPTVGVAPESP